MESSVSDYWQYLQNLSASLSPELLDQISILLADTSLDNPTSGRDFNNFAVFALIEAENSEDLSQREFYLGIATEALNREEALDEYPLCAAHLALVLAAIGQIQSAINLALTTFLKILPLAYTENQKLLPGLVYFPVNSTKLGDLEISQIIAAENSYQQSILLISQVLCYSTSVFYDFGLRALHLAIQILPDSPTSNLKLGVASILNNQMEGVLYLHRASKIAPEDAKIWQALHLIYRDLKQPIIAQSFLQKGRSLRQQNPNQINWQWTNLESNSAFTYVPFENNLILTVEASLCSIVTSVLLAEGDWFENEIEFWRHWIEPGMTVIDVGANVGVYTFSAAQKVGSSGCVLAVEPFSGGVSCLSETCRINEINWVKVCAGAASDRNGFINLQLEVSNEYNAIISDEDAAEISPEKLQKVACFTLDSLVEKENLNRVDLLKIDAEGHEMSVLLGSETILTQFAPLIIYENVISGVQNSNLPVAEFLLEKGYQLFSYQPFLRKLIPIDNLTDLPAKLNIIALPEGRVAGINT